MRRRFQLLKLRRVSSLSDPDIFETEVRRIASSLWPDSRGGALLVSGQERDGIYHTEDIVHGIECTTSRKKEKAEKDAEKLKALARKLKPKLGGRAFKGWFVTLDDPTADQRGVVDSVRNRSNILLECISFSDFRRRLIDTKQYLECRREHPFGSARNLATNKTKGLNNYIRPPLIARTGSKTSKNAILSPEDLVDLALHGQRIVLLGDYGAGKSMTMRECWSVLADRHLRNEEVRFPILLNLRDHFGQKHPEEALERHGRNIGFSDPAKLVRAWKAGYAIILLDGFDEIAVPGWVRRKALSESRRDAMEVIRRFARESDGLFLAGRMHYFDSETELRHATEIHRGYEAVDLNDFEMPQAQKYIKDLAGNSTTIPNWLPSRPLLLGYLASKGALPQHGTEVAIGPAEGWNTLLHEICQREAQIEAGVDGPTLRRTIERLASEARFDHDGVGPLSPSAIEQAFRDVCGGDPDEHALILLQRLPGLSAVRSEDGSRGFVDSDFADAARAGDVVAFIESPHQTLLETDRWCCPLRDLGLAVAIHRLTGSEWITPNQVSAALSVAQKRLYSPTLISDLAMILIGMGGELLAPLNLQDVVFRELDLEDLGSGFAYAKLQSCVVQTLRIPSDFVEADLPTFSDCLIGSVVGRVSETDLPVSKFIDCSFEEFSGKTETVSGILELDIPPGKRVMLTVLRKLYLQRGTGRKESALFRGISDKDRTYVEPVLSILSSFGLALQSRAGREKLWLPSKGERARVLEVLNSPTMSQDPILLQAAQL